MNDQKSLAYIIHTLETLYQWNNDNPALSDILQWFTLHQSTDIQNVKESMQGIQVICDNGHMDMFDALLWFLSYSQNLTRNISLGLFH